MGGALNNSISWISHLPLVQEEIGWSPCSASGKVQVFLCLYEQLYHRFHLRMGEFFLTGGRFHVLTRKLEDGGLSWLAHTAQWKEPFVSVLRSPVWGELG